MCRHIVSLISVRNIIKPTTLFNIQKFYVVITWNFCVLYGSRMKQQILPERA